MKKGSTTNGLVTRRDSQQISGHDLASQSVEMEEVTDVYFFRPAGLLFARGARVLGMTPIGVTMVGAGVGIAGGALLYDLRLGLIGFALLILHGIIDSADGQLARMTGLVTELGRVLDGVGGYVTHIAIYVGITAGFLHRGAPGTVVLWAGVAALANVVQAQMYEYHRHHYKTIVTRKLVPLDNPEGINSTWIASLYRWYLGIQRMTNRPHVEVESILAARSVRDVVREEDAARYRECFYWPVRGWNLLGDNIRFYAIGVLALLHRIDLFFAFILLPMNLVLVALWFWQRSADRRFLARM